MGVAKMDNIIKYMLPLIPERIKQIDNQIALLRQEHLEIETVLAKIENANLDQLKSDPASYDSSWKVWEKVRFILHREQRPLKAKYITDFIVQLENAIDRKKIASQISTVLSSRIGSEIVKHDLPGERPTYSLMPWPVNLKRSWNRRAVQSEP